MPAAGANDLARMPILYRWSRLPGGQRAAWKRFNQVYSINEPTSLGLRIRGRRRWASSAQSYDSSLPFFLPLPPANPARLQRRLFTLNSARPFPQPAGKSSPGERAGASPVPAPAAHRSRPERACPQRPSRYARCTAVEHTTCRFVARKDQENRISVRQVDNGAVCCQSLVRGQQDELLELRFRD